MKRARNSVRNPDNCKTWRDNRRSDGWRHVQFWARPHVVAALGALLDRARVVAPSATAKEIIEDLILKA